MRYPRFQVALLLVAATTPVLASAQSDGLPVAAEMRFHRASSDTLLLDSITSPAALIRDNAIFQAALEIAGDHSASAEARVFSFRALIQQLRPGWIIRYGDLANSAVRNQGCLGLGVPDHGPATLLGAALPANAVQQVATRSREIGTSQAEPLAVRGAASCATAYNSIAAPLGNRGMQMNVVAGEPLTITYVCENKFTIRNPLGTEVRLTYSVEGASETGHLVLPESSATTLTELTTQASGTVILVEDYEGGEELARATNGGVPCS
jgi:hypothetical protein